MAPSRRLPDMKGGRQKAAKVVTDFTTPASAHATLKTREDATGEAERQESQGARYQHGSKSLRHYQAAIVCLKLVDQLGPNQFETIYNIARLSLLLATDFLAAPHCLEGVADAIDWYRKALGLLGTGEGREGEAIDGGLNLAQALAVLAGMIEDGAQYIGSDQRMSKRFGGKGMGYLFEARELFRTGEALQTREMEKSGFGGSGMTEETEGELMAVEGNLEVEATQSNIVVPALVLATVLDSIANDLVIFRLSTPPSTDTAALIIASLSRALQLRNLIPADQAAANPTQDLDLELSTLTISAALNSACISHPFYQTSDLIINAYVSLIKSHPKNPELPSEYADYLIDSLSSSLPTSLAGTMNEIQQSYRLSHSLLADPFRPRGSIPVIAIPSMIAFNLVSQAYSLLLAHHLSPSANLRSQCTTLLSNAIESAGAGMKLVRSSSGSYALEMKSADGRRDWQTIKALREALLLLIRLFIRDESIMQEARSIVEVLGKLVGRDGRDEVGRCLEEIRDDALWEVCGNEQAMWEKLLA